MPPDFTQVTELPGNRASAEQLEMIHTRYAWARSHAAGQEVLEAACGPGRGLGYLLRGGAREVVGLDYERALVEMGNAHHRGRIKIVEGDASALPFAGESFGLVILFEAIYYLPDAGRFVAEAKRVLKTGGRLLICSANKEWSGFNPSPFSVRYYSALELRDLLAGHGLWTELKAGFPADERRGLRGAAVSVVRRAAVGLGLVPKTMKGKALLKRLFYGRLASLGPEIDDSVPVRPLDPVTAFPVTGFKVLYALGVKR